MRRRAARPSLLRDGRGGSRFLALASVGTVAVIYVALVLAGKLTREMPWFKARQPAQQTLVAVDGVVPASMLPKETPAPPSPDQVREQLLRGRTQGEAPPDAATPPVPALEPGAEEGTILLAPSRLDPLPAPPQPAASSIAAPAGPGVKTE